MSAYMPHLAPVVVLLFLGSGLLVLFSFLVLFYGAVRRSAFFTRLGASVVVSVAAGYLVLLCGVSFASSEQVLPPGSWKYFCEIDCHIAYSVMSTQTMAALGPELQRIRAQGKFVVVRVKTWFDEKTISPMRGNGPLTPNPRRVSLVDDAGRKFPPSPDGESALSRAAAASTPLTQALRPGESYDTDLVFDVPAQARGLRLLITDDSPETRVLIGHENSLLHKKIYLALG